MDFYFDFSDEESEEDVTPFPDEFWLTRKAEIEVTFSYPDLKFLSNERCRWLDNCVSLVCLCTDRFCKN
jgi:hypothetical protein